MHSAVVDDPKLLFGTQLVRVRASGGALGLEYDRELSSAVPYDASALQVREAIEALSRIHAVTVTVVDDGPELHSWRVTFLSYTGALQMLSALPWSSAAPPASPSTRPRTTTPAPSVRARTGCAPA